MSNDSMKRQQQQDSIDPTSRIDSDLFKDPLKQRESEHEQEWKFRQVLEFWMIFLKIILFSDISSHCPSPVLPPTVSHSTPPSSCLQEGVQHRTPIPAGPPPYLGLKFLQDQVHLPPLRSERAVLCCMCALDQPMLVAQSLGDLWVPGLPMGSPSPSTSSILSLIGP